MIQTVNGPVQTEQLGITYVHEHFLWKPPEPFADQDPDLRLDSLEAAKSEAGWFKTAGGGCIVEMTTVELERDPQGMAAISKSAGIHIVAATGFNKSKFSRTAVAPLSVQELAAGMVSDLLDGMQGSAIRAGLIKASSSQKWIDPDEEKVFQAAAEAHRLTGAPISTHTEAGEYALQQIEMLTRLGVPTESLLIGHLDRKLEWEALRAAAETGVYLGIDQIGKAKYYPDEARIEMLSRLLEAGYQKQILLSGDMARRSSWPSYGFGCGPGLTYIIWRFVPWMLSSGIPHQAVEDMLIHNPARFLSWKSTPLPL